MVAILAKVLTGNKQKLKSLSLLMPAITVVVLSFFWIHTDFYTRCPVLVLITVGLQVNLITMKMIIATVTVVSAFC